MVQQVVIGILFLGAAAYVVRLLIKSFQAKSGCATNCGKCSTIDVDAIEKKIRTNSVTAKGH